MSNNIWEGRTILMEKDDWVLVPPRSMDPSGLQSLPLHKPCNVGCAVTKKGAGHHRPWCCKCDAPVPEEMEAAYILHNWEVRKR